MILGIVNDDLVDINTQNIYQYFFKFFFANFFLEHNLDIPRLLYRTNDWCNDWEFTLLTIKLFYKLFTIYFDVISLTFLPKKKKEGVKISSLPPSHRSIAVALRRADTLVDPSGAIRRSSRVHTIE